MTPDCDREWRIAELTRRADAGLPLFDAAPSNDGPCRRKESAACWACGVPLRMSRYTRHTFVSRPFLAERETYCVDCFEEYGFPEPVWEVV